MWKYFLSVHKSKPTFTGGLAVLILLFAQLQNKKRACKDNHIPQHIQIFDRKKCFFQFLFGDLANNHYLCSPFLLMKAKNGNTFVCNYFKQANQ